jgi:copper resistance protein D
MDAWWYHLSVFLHILCAIIWIGGMLFIVMILAPLLRSADFRAQAVRVLHVTGKKFKRIAWCCFGVLLVTGFLNAGARWGFANLFTAGFWSTPYPGQVLLHKLLTFVLVICLSWLHDFQIGPRAVSAMRAAADAPETARLRKTAAWMGRGNLFLALLILWAGVRLVRP